MVKTLIPLFCIMHEISGFQLVEFRRGTCVLLWSLFQSSMLYIKIDAFKNTRKSLSRKVKEKKLRHGLLEEYTCGIHNMLRMPFSCIHIHIYIMVRGNNLNNLNNIKRLIYIRKVYLLFRKMYECFLKWYSF